jgi:hypothetical protein
MSIEKVLEKILKGTSDKNIKFQDLRKLLIIMIFQNEYEVITLFSQKNIFLN